MLNTTTAPAGFPSESVGARKVDTSRGGMRGDLSSQWFTRPDDQRFLSLSALRAAVGARCESSESRIVDVSKSKLYVNDHDSNIYVYDKWGSSVFENWSFGQACQLLTAPAGYLRRLPPTIAAINLQHGMANFRSEMGKTYRQDTGSDVGVLRAVTGPDYGRITDAEVVDAIMTIAGDGTGDTDWKVPGVMNWSDMQYNPYVDVSKETTTLFASDRDVFIFLVDDTHPIEIGKLADGSPDLIFRGFYAWNSEVGSKSLGIATMYLRGICANRCLWGVENFQTVTMRHSKYAPERFAAEHAPALRSFASGSTGKLLEGINDAKGAIVARNDEERLEFLQKQRFSKAASQDIINTVLREEGKAPESIWDMVQGITAKARTIGHQDARIDMERVAGKLLDKVA